jgi:hypothetical protein
VSALATDNIVEKIESIFAITTDSRATFAKLGKCELLVVNYSLLNCSTQNTPLEQASKIAKAVWEIDLTTVERVRVAQVRDKMHVEFWPAKKSLMSRILGLPTSVRQTKTMHHCNGDAYEQDEGIAVGIMVPKAADPELAQLLTDYIEGHCK